ncbi:MAG: sugar ABC transporter permease [Anaerolineae bacterium]|nr:sugar ABC transporter permease [Anaerolineae bacterium]
MSQAVAAGRVGAARGLLSARAKENLTGWLWAAPWVLGFLIFTLGPMLASVYFSFTDFPVISPPKWVGLENYRTMISGDKSIFQALKVTTIYAVVAIPLNLTLGFFLAILLNQPIKGVAVWRTVYYLPAVVSGVAVALLWQWIFNTDFGLANWLLSLVGVKGPRWLLDPGWALPALIIMSMWGVGGGMIINLAGLQSVPTHLYEAAEIDGAGAWRRFWTVTVPMVSPVIFFNLVMGIIGALQTFTQAFIMTGGGPREATYFYMLHLYNNAFQWLKMGYAAALAWVLFFYILFLTLLVIRSSSAWVYYEGELRRG